MGNNFPAKIAIVCFYSSLTARVQAKYRDLVSAFLRKKNIYYESHQTSDYNKNKKKTFMYKTKEEITRCSIVAQNMPNTF